MTAATTSASSAAARKRLERHSSSGPLSSPSSSSSSLSPPPLDSAAALHTLLSPDGYYSYLNVPKPRTATSSSAEAAAASSRPPDGASPGAGAAADNGVDADLVKRNYRRLSLRHHPDRPGGDAETFRVLNRAKRVLTNSKLRRQYDLLGLDLDEDEDEDEGREEEEKKMTTTGDGNGGGGNDDNDRSKDADDRGKRGGNGADGAGKESGGKRERSGGGSDGGVISHMASATLAALLQAAVHIAMMTAASTLVCRYKLLLLPAILFLMFITYRVVVTSKQVPAGIITAREKTAPSIVALGLVLMHRGRAGTNVPWSWTFWLGETWVMGIFLSNSIPSGHRPRAVLLDVACVLCAAVLSLLLRGKFWRYFAVLCFDAALGVVALLAFPVMEMVLEEIMNEKMRKIGEKVRAHAERLERQYKMALSSSSEGMEVPAAVSD